jgi:hypothetical protein
MREHEVVEEIIEAIYVYNEDYDAFGEELRVYTFDDVGMMTQNKGFVLRLSDGKEFQITVVRSR